MRPIKPSSRAEASARTDEVRGFFDRYADSFDSLYDPSRRTLVGRLLDRLFRRVMLERFSTTLRYTADPRIQTVLDVGCGSGRYVTAFLSQGKEVVGIDLSADMLRIAEAAVPRSAHKRWALVCGNYLTHHFDRRFDAACLMGYFDYVDDPRPHWAKLTRDVNLEVYASFPLRGGLLAFQRRLRYRLRRCPLHLYRRQEIEETLQALGLLGSSEFIPLGRDLFVRVLLPGRDDRASR